MIPSTKGGRKAAAGAAAPNPASDYLLALVFAVALAWKRMSVAVEVRDYSGSMHPAAMEQAAFFTRVRDVAVKQAVPGSLDRVLLVQVAISAAPVFAPITPYTKAVGLEAPPNGSTAQFETAAELARLLTLLTDRAAKEGVSIKQTDFRFVGDGRSTFESDELVQQGWEPLVKVLRRIGANVTVIGPKQEMCDLPVLEDLAKPFGQPVYMLDTADATLYQWQVADLLSMTGQPTSREDPTIRDLILKARQGK
jgi:hypothetical protein